MTQNARNGLYQSFKIKFPSQTTCEDDAIVTERKMNTKTILCRILERVFKMFKIFLGAGLEGMPLRKPCLRKILATPLQGSYHIMQMQRGSFRIILISILQ